ncbi:M3 family peptidase [cyanobiont of Ornithocercus magnificus]|nr:M3 family peptidase [cyanobiont of Ornithocercus magnificus]
MTILCNDTTISPLLKGRGIPNYSAITAQSVQEDIPKLLRELNDNFDRFEANLKNYFTVGKRLSWELVIDPLHLLEERLRWSWGTVSHLNAVCNTPELRAAYAKQQSEVVRFRNHIGQSKLLYLALQSLRDQPAKTLDKTQKRILAKQLLSMRHRGVALDSNSLETFNIVSEQLATLATQFSNNILDATQEWSLLLHERELLSGIPLRILAQLAIAAEAAGNRRKDGSPPTTEQGPWLLGLDTPSYLPVITYATNRNLREKLYRAYVSRASQGKFNNRPLTEEILRLRIHQAALLGYKDWAEFSLTSKMAGKTDAVELLLEELRLASLPVAEAELQQLCNFAAECGAPESHNIQPWDVMYWAERLRREHLNFDQESLRPWFSLPQVLSGLFKLCKRLFNIYIEPADGSAPVWHEDVRFFRVLDPDGLPLAYFYLDPYSRPASKRGGAWMSECLVPSHGAEGHAVLPIAYLVCNQTPPIGNMPSLMSFEEVETLFHEFGHGLHHMLTDVNYPHAAGINCVEWDAVELPSQFMENWCYERKTLFSMAHHWQTGEPLSEQDYELLLQNRTFMAGSATLRQIHLALTDLRLHSSWKPEDNHSPEDLRRKIAAVTTVLAPIDEDQLLCQFAHIFASSSYAAGYYSYKWAEVLSADIFAAFKEAGLDDEKQIRRVGSNFLANILSKGGSRAPLELFEAFRGRLPTSEALIHQSGLACT